MVDRRRAVRFVLTAPTAASIQVVQDAVLQHADRDRARLLTAEPASPGDAFTLQFSRGDEVFTRAVRVLSSTPVVRNNVVSYQLELMFAPVDLLPSTGLTSRRGEIR